MARLLRGGDVDDIQELHQQGLSITGIAELTGFDRKTVRKWVTEPGPPRYGPRPPRASELAPFKAYIEQRLTAGVWNTVATGRI